MQSLRRMSSNTSRIYPVFYRLFREKLCTGGEFVVSGPTESPVYRLGRTVAGFGGKGDYHHTNIDNLIGDITDSGFALRETRRLPFPGLPTLFKICRFEIA